MFNIVATMNDVNLKTKVAETMFVTVFGFVETPRKFIIAIINLCGVSTKLN